MTEQTATTIGLPVTVTFDLAEMFRDRGDELEFGVGAVLVPLIAREAIKKLVEDSSWPSMAQQIRNVRDDEIREQLRPMIADTLASAIQRTNNYGEPTGEPITLREVVAETGRKLLTEPQRDRRGYGTSETMVRRLIREEVDAAFGRELKAALDEAKSEIRAAVQAKGAVVLAETIQRMAAQS